MQEIIFKNYLTLTQDEHIKLLNIRNSDYVRQGSKSKVKISYDNHLKWVQTHSNTDKIYYAIFVDSELYGGINLFDIQTNNPSWGLFFKEDNIPFLSSLITYIFFNKIFDEYNIEILFSEVERDNISAYRFSLSMGMQVYNTINGYYQFKLLREDWQYAKTTKILKMIERKVSTLDYRFEG